MTSLSQESKILQRTRQDTAESKCTKRINNREHVKTLVALKETIRKNPSMCEHIYPMWAKRLYNESYASPNDL